MKILICSDGMAAADNATQLGALLAAPIQAETTVLGIAEKSGDEGPLREALEKQAEWFRGKGVNPKIAVGNGEPVHQIVDETRFDGEVVLDEIRSVAKRAMTDAEVQTHYQEGGVRAAVHMMRGDALKAVPRGGICPQPRGKWPRRQTKSVRQGLKSAAGGRKSGAERGKSTE